jgi:hypothetical protein
MSTPQRAFDDYPADVPTARAAWRRLGIGVLLIFNVLALVGLAWLGIDWWVRYRAEQLILQYHSGVIVPMTQPKPPAAPAPGGK